MHIFENSLRLLCKKELMYQLTCFLVSDAHDEIKHSCHQQAYKTLIWKILPLKTTHFISMLSKNKMKKEKSKLLRKLTLPIMLFPYVIMKHTQK